ncbi:MAG: HAD-IB family hydrolase [Halioglobus sp.]|nr:HAD-IB family hydrolase [Halioglobus sp.]
MARHLEVIREVEESDSGSHIGAFFDFDGTIIHGYSAFAMIREQVRRGDLSPREFMELATAMTSFGLGNTGFSAMMIASAQFMRGISEASYREFGEELYRDHLAKLVYPESRALIEAHQRKGHTVAIISSATPYQLLPAARDLGIGHVMCTRLEVEGGEFTGGVLRPTCFGPGKVRAAEELARECGLDLEQSYFYSDSDDDIELLERVGRPRPLNPNRKLASIARRERWPVRRFGSRGRAGVLDWARSVAATGSLVSSFAAGLPIWAITGSRREAQNFSFSLFADTAAALIGLELNVKGEEHLWSSRPCVFVFNHQSKADVVIAAKLLRRDIAGVGKREIRKMPVIGQVLELGGVVLIDRANAASAIEAMQPLVDAMQDEGKCVVLAPEGTRTVSPRLAPFKKGAFHLAMQAGVPMVPIVIHNALDVAPKGEFVFRAATVDVEVLPPVDTSGWSVATLDEHVAEVRNMFLRTLGQEVPVSAAGSTTRRPSSGRAAAKKPAGKTSATKKPAKKKPATKKPARKKPAAAKTSKAGSTPKLKRKTGAGGRSRPKNGSRKGPAE